MEIIQKIKALAEEQRLDCIRWRRHLHTHPELSFSEIQTASYIRSILKENGFENVTPVGKNGTLATIEGKNKGKTIMLRADIDALPIQENTALEFSSAVPGVMHACGHDGHTAMLLSASRILLNLRAAWDGTIKVLFQPAEEIIPGGAVEMIEAGVLENPVVQEAIGQHVMPRLPTGKVGIRAGKFMASSDDFVITIHGKGGHGAMPETLIDPVVIAGHIIVALQQIVSRNRNPRIPSVLSIGRVIAAGSVNVIPNDVTLEGTFRTVDAAWREQGLAILEKMATDLASSMGASCTVVIRRGYPFLHNDERLALTIKESLIAYMGETNVVHEDIWMAAEDFAHYSHRVPSTFYLLGIRNEAKGITSGLHTPTFMIDEDALILGAGLMAWVAYRQMR